VVEVPGKWIYDISHDPGGINLWVMEKNETKKYHEPYRNSFYLSIPETSTNYDLTICLEETGIAEKETFRTIYGEKNGWRVYSGRSLAESIEKKTRYRAEIYNLDVRAEQKYLAEHSLSLCLDAGDEVFSTDAEHPLTVMKVKVAGEPHIDRSMKKISIGYGDETVTAEGDDHSLTELLITSVSGHDPQVILFGNADSWMHRICTIADELKIFNSLSKTGEFRPLQSRSYFSYGRMEYKPSAMIPEGRIIIDSAQSFMYREGDLSGIFLASRLTGISPNLTSRFTPGTAVSNYEVLEALKKKICVPFRKSDAEMLRSSEEVRIDYRGGLILQPRPSVYEKVNQLDFTSFYPSIIVNYNLSPETLQNPSLEGFLPSVIGPLLDFRIHTKAMKKENPDLKGMDSMLKWMLVTCFGYTGYKNAKFGRIELHEMITTIATDILKDVCDISESLGLEVLHGIVDCVWVQGDGIKSLKAAVEEKYRIPTEIECYDWICFLPQKDGSGSYNNYYGRLCSGSMKMRGIAARRKDMPVYIRRMQEEMVKTVCRAKTVDELLHLEDEVREIYNRYYESLPDAPLSDFVIRKKMGRESYTQNCISSAVIGMYSSFGVKVSAGMDATFVVRDEKKHIVDPEWNIRDIDLAYYRKLADKAAEEVFFLFSAIRDEGKINPVNCCN